jgi:Uma2 family endonuclease
MSTVIEAPNAERPDAPSDDPPIVVPVAATESLDGFRAWVTSGDFPDRGKVIWFQQQLVFVMSPERINSHNQVKLELTLVLGGLVRDHDLGIFYPDGAWFTNDDAGLSSEADATFCSWETLQSKRVREIPTRGNDDTIELRGAPDWVLEVVSPSSVRKDTAMLRDAYFLAGVREYWIVDARGDSLSFRILSRGESEFVEQPAEDEWRSSEVFRGSFRLSREKDRIGGWAYSLEHQSAEAEA